MSRPRLANLEPTVLRVLSSNFVDIKLIVQNLGYEYPGEFAPHIRRALESATAKGLAERSAEKNVAQWRITTAGRAHLADLGKNHNER